MEESLEERQQKTNSEQMIGKKLKQLFTIYHK